MRVFSRTNLFYMRQVYGAWSGMGDTVQQLVGQLPWGHHLILLARVSEPSARLWYLEQAVLQGWSRSILSIHVASGLHKRQGKALSNFSTTLASPQAALAQQALRDPYVFDFLSLGPNVQERELELALVAHVQRFLLELGVGFAFVGRQVHLEVGQEDFFLDLLFYNLKLRCFVVIELKAVPFKPEFAGKMNFYLSAVDAQLRHPEDRPSIGLLLCHSKDRLVVEYALRGLGTPIVVAGAHRPLTGQRGGQEAEGAPPPGCFWREDRETCRASPGRPSCEEEVTRNAFSCTPLPQVGWLIRSSTESVHAS